MTVIAWDGVSLAADRRSCSGSAVRSLTKIFRVGDALVGAAGDTDMCCQLIAWFRAGHDPTAFPESQRDRDNWAGLLVVWPDGAVWKYERTPHPIQYDPQLFSIGSGRDFALAAMHLGKTAAEAVAVACALDSGCGDGVDILTHEGQP
jgi:ATP-dependent protease HslVU (ClpYQ) peptidase subunit